MTQIPPDPLKARSVIKAKARLLFQPPQVPWFLLSFVALLSLSVSLAAAQAFEPGFPYGPQKVRGVNLGGWLVLKVLRTIFCLFASCSL